MDDFNPALKSLRQEDCEKHECGILSLGENVKGHPIDRFFLTEVTGVVTVSVLSLNRSFSSHLSHSLLQAQAQRPSLSGGPHIRTCLKICFTAPLCVIRTKPVLHRFVKLVKTLWYFSIVNLYISLLTNFVSH